MKTLVTGNAGFIGFHTAKRLLERGDSVVGMDVVNDYYDVALKHGRLAELDRIATETGSEYTFLQADIADRAAVEAAFKAHQPTHVINLAAQAGVRHSVENPHAYVHSNLSGFTTLLEACRHHGVQHLTYASTSSVYGGNRKMPFSEAHGVDHPLQFYAATKRANELMAHSYAHLFGLPTTGLRFFTVYGPWGRPDMALFKFTKAILAGEPIPLFNNGNHSRDFTYIDDIVESVVRISDKPASPNPQFDAEAPEPQTSNAPFRIYNIGNNAPVPLLDYVAALESALGVKAARQLLPLQPGDVPDTYADASALSTAVDYRPETPVLEGVSAFVKWYRDYYQV